MPWYKSSHISVWRESKHGDLLKLECGCFAIVASKIRKRSTFSTGSSEDPGWHLSLNVEVTKPCSHKDHQEKAVHGGYLEIVSMNGVQILDPFCAALSATFN